MSTARPPSLSQDPRLTKGERTRLQLLEVAAAEFAERGFQHTRISDIVARAGVTQPVFYQYFTSKQAAYDELVGMFAEACAASSARSASPARRVRGWTSACAPASAACWPSCARIPT